MHKEIVINSTANQIRVGILEDHELVEYSMETADALRSVGNVYLGIVTAVRPGLQAAFVDIGQDKAGFLHVRDLVHDETSDDGRRGRGRPRREGLRPIETMLKEGDRILVQMTKEAIGTKGPRLSADISLPGRFLVLMPKASHVGVSRKIEDRQERSRLKELLQRLRPREGAFIIRTAGEGIDEKLLQEDMEHLNQLWQNIVEAVKTVVAPALVHEDVGLLVGMVRDIFTEDVGALHIDNREDYDRLTAYVKTFSPDLKRRIHFYDGDVPIFDKFGIETELRKSLERKVWMKRGGYIIIEETEALVSVDVNTGRYTGKKNQEETILRTNLLAAREIPRQLRLRDIGGIIVIDFIDMESEENKRKLLHELRTHLRRDRARTKTFALSDLGLVEMSRQRVRESLKERLSDECPFCRGTARILSLETLANEVERMLTKVGTTMNEKAIQILANPSLALHLQMERGQNLEELSRRYDLRIDVLDDARIHREEFRILAMPRRKDLTRELEGIAGRSERTGRLARPARGVHRRGTRTERTAPPEPSEVPAPSRSGRSGRSGEERRSRRGRGRRSAAGGEPQSSRRSATTPRTQESSAAGARAPSRNARDASPPATPAREEGKTAVANAEEAPRRRRRRRRRGRRREPAAGGSGARTPAPPQDTSGDSRWGGAQTTASDREAEPAPRAATTGATPAPPAAPVASTAPATSKATATGARGEASPTGIAATPPASPAAGRSVDEAVSSAPPDLHPHRDRREPDGYASSRRDAEDRRPDGVEDPRRDAVQPGRPAEPATQEERPQRPPSLGPESWAATRPPASDDVKGASLTLPPNVSPAPRPTQPVTPSPGSPTTGSGEAEAAPRGRGRRRRRRRPRGGASGRRSSSDDGSGSEPPGAKDRSEKVEAKG